MKKTIKLAVVAALALGTTSAFATNGSNLIGMGAKSRSMGGVSIGTAQGAQSAVGNAALMTSVESSEVSFGGTLFMPDVATSVGAGATANSKADMSVIPEVSLVSKVSDNFYAGIGMWGTAGMGVDFRDSATNFNMVTNLQVMQFGIPLAYKMDAFSVSFTPVVQYGALDIEVSANTATGSGVSQDLAMGYVLGAAYQANDLTVGLQYKSGIDMNFDNQLVNPGAAFGLTLPKELGTPAEYGIGLSYAMGEHTISYDYKKIDWSGTVGYKEMKWEDQNVHAVGYEYAAKGWSARVGYNYASNPLEVQAMTAAGGLATNTLNYLGFPGMVESHYTVGGTYDVSKTSSIDLTYVRAASNKETVAGTNGAALANVVIDHSQDSISIALNMAF